MNRIAAAALLALPVLCHAQDLSFFLGQSRMTEPHDTSPAWMLAYTRDLAPHVFASVLYINEGHFIGHHRDGMAAQLGLSTPPVAAGFSLQAALGPYRYFDTSLAATADGFADAHGTGLVYSAAITWQHTPSSPWNYHVRIDRIEGRRSMDTSLVMAGVSYGLQQDATFSREGFPRGNAPRDEVVFSLGQTIVNSFEGQNSTARTVDYRHAFTPVVRGSVSWINEGDARLIRRNGVVLQGWLEPTFFDGLYSLGVGFGPYVAIDRYHGGGPDVLGMLSTSMSYRIARAWDARLTWHRSVSSYDRDSDIFVLGLGYRF